MDEMNKKLAEAHADAAAHKARADQAEKDRDTQKSRADQAEKDRDQAKTEAFNARKDAETALATVDAEKARADQAEKDAQAKIEKAEADAKAADEKSRADAASDLDTRVAAKVALVSEAAPIIGTNDKGEKVDVAKMADRDIRCAVVLRVDGEDLAKMNPKPSDDFVAGVYKGAVGRHARAASSRADARTVITDTREQGVTVVVNVQSAADAEKAATENLRARMAAGPASVTDNASKKDKE